MSSSLSRFIGGELMLSLKAKDELWFFKPVSKTPFLKNKEYAWNLVGKSCKNLSMSKTLQTTTFVRHSNVNPPPEAPLPSGSPSGSLRNWIVGMVLSIIIPFVTHKWGSLLLLKNKVDKKIETTEHVVKTIENVATRVDKVIDNITDDLPNDSQVKKALEFVDEIAEGVAKSAHVADNIINKVFDADSEAIKWLKKQIVIKDDRLNQMVPRTKVEEAEDKLESLITHENSKGDELPQEDEDKEHEEISREEDEKIER